MNQNDSGARLHQALAEQPQMTPHSQNPSRLSYQGQTEKTQRAKANQNQLYQKLQRSGADSATIDSFKRTEVIRRALDHVKDNAHRQKVSCSPTRLHREAKSKVTANFQTRKRVYNGNGSVSPMRSSQQNKTPTGQKQRNKSPFINSNATTNNQREPPQKVKDLQDCIQIKEQELQNLHTELGNSKYRQERIQQQQQQYQLKSARDYRPQTQMLMAAATEQKKMQGSPIKTKPLTKQKTTTTINSQFSKKTTQKKRPNQNSAQLQTGEYRLDASGHQMPSYTDFQDQLNKHNQKGGSRQGGPLYNDHDMSNAELDEFKDFEKQINHRNTFGDYSSQMQQDHRLEISDDLGRAAPSPPENNAAGHFGYHEQQLQYDQQNNNHSHNGETPCLSVQFDKQGAEGSEHLAYHGDQHQNYQTIQHDNNANDSRQQYMTSFDSGHASARNKPSSSKGNLVYTSPYKQQKGMKNTGRISTASKKQQLKEMLQNQQQPQSQQQQQNLNKTASPRKPFLAGSRSTFTNYGIQQVSGNSNGELASTYVEKVNGKKINNKGGYYLAPNAFDIKTTDTRKVQQAARQFNNSKSPESRRCQAIIDQVVSQACAKHTDNQFHNPDLEKKTLALQKEFDRIQNHQDDFKAQLSQMKSKRKEDDFYKMLDDFYADGHQTRHESPTRRLIDQKHSATKSKQKVQQDVRHGQAYKLHYNHSPDKHYVIEPKGGELNYALAYKNPVKFYNQVVSQQITQHKVWTDSKGRQQVSSKVTQRKIGQILYTVTDKLTELFKSHYAGLQNFQTNQVDQEHQQLVEQALQDPQVKDVIYDQMAQDKLKLVRKGTNEPVFHRETTLLGKKGDRALDEESQTSQSQQQMQLHSDQHDYESSIHDEIGEQESHVEPEDADLHVDQQAFTAIDKSVKKYIARNSLK